METYSPLGDVYVESVESQRLTDPLWLSGEQRLENVLTLSATTTATTTAVLQLCFAFCYYQRICRMRMHHEYFAHAFLHAPHRFKSHSLPFHFHFALYATVTACILERAATIAIVQSSHSASVQPPWKFNMNHKSSKAIENFRIIKSALRQGSILMQTARPRI